MIRDVALFIHSVMHAGLRDVNEFYWDNTNKGELDDLVERLSKVDDSERREIRKILKEHRPSRILDAGCGPATEKISYDALGFGITYFGLDMSANMLGVAKERFPSSEFVRGDVEKLPFEGNSFDGVVLKHILEHLPCYQNSIREAVRVSRGIVIINLFHRLIPGGQDIQLVDKKGFFNNWYSKSKFERFLGQLSLSQYQRTAVISDINHRTTSELYLLQKV